MITKSKENNLENLITIVADYYQVDPEKIVSRKRIPEIIGIRQLAMYLAKELTGMSLREIGIQFGRNDHSSTSHEKLYEYQTSERKNVELDNEDCLYIATLLSKGEEISKEIIMKELKPLVFKLPVEDSVKVKILKWISNPPKEPRMTKLAPIMGELFPEVKAAIKDIYQETRIPSEWTVYAERELRQVVNSDIENQVRRDIIQCLFTDYLLHDLNKCDDLKLWSREGGLG